MNKRIGLVIQGPLVSIGRAGNNLHATPEQLKQSGGLVRFDCRPNIQRLISEYGHLFDEIVVSTWENEVVPGEMFAGAKLVAAPDPGGIPQAGHYKDNNKHRQFVSTLNGLLELEKNRVDYAVKTRTDVYLDLELVLASFFEKIEKHANPKAIGATVVHPQTFLLHDLYFASALKPLMEFCEAIEAYDRFEFIPSVHREMVLKHAFAVYRKEINVPDSAYFPISPPGGASAVTRRIFDYMFDKVYFSLDPEIFRRLEWRGVRFDADHVSSLVDKKSVGRRYAIPNWVGTDWLRYFSFRKEVYGVEISLTDRLLAKVGKLGWDVWNMARKAVRMVR